MVSDDLTNQVHHPLTAVIDSALKAPVKASELYLSRDGSVYQAL